MVWYSTLQYSMLCYIRVWYLVAYYDNRVIADYIMPCCARSLFAIGTPMLSFDDEIHRAFA